MKYIVFDLETTTVTYKGRKASPFYSGNKIVVLQYKVAGEAPKAFHIDDVPVTTMKHDFYKRLNECELLIGHNIKFDLLYIWGDQELQTWIKNGGKIYDTMVTEYILSGQTKLYPSLDYCSEKYGGTLKDDAIKQAWKAGLETTEIDKDMLVDYAINDVINTEIVAKAQAFKAKELGMTNLIRAQMDAVLATTEMEYNGLYVDRKSTYLSGKRVLKSLIQMKQMIQNKVKDFPNWIIDEDFNPNSTQQLALMLFGGDLKYKEAQPVLGENGEPVVFKTGKRAGETKTKLVECTKYMHGVFKSIPDFVPRTPGGAPQLNNTTIKKLMKDKCTIPVTEFLSKLLEYKLLTKQYNTYYLGWLKLTSHNIIRGNLNHVSTDTGRLSSSNPNMQNLPRKQNEESQTD